MGIKVKLEFEYEIKPEDGCGSQCDALNCAVRELEYKLANADGNDDLGEIFEVSFV